MRVPAVALPRDNFACFIENDNGRKTALVRFAIFLPMSFSIDIRLSFSIKHAILSQYTALIAFVIAFNPQRDKINVHISDL